MRNERMRVHHSTGKDDWETPVSFFAPLQDEFGITIDLAANAANHMPECFWFGPNHPKPWRRDTLHTPIERTSPQTWAWCNPPYSRQLQPDFVRYCALRGRVVMLLPARTDTRTFHSYIWHVGTHQSRVGVEVRFVKGRIKFVGAKDSAPFPSMVIVFR